MSETEQQNKDVIQESVDAFFNSADPTAIDRYYSPDYVHHQSPDEYGIDELRNRAHAIFAAFPDLHIHTDFLAADGYFVTKKWTLRCTHKGEYIGIPASGNQVEIEGIALFRIRDGRIAECWEVMDSFALLQQLGAIPAAAG